MGQAASKDSYSYAWKTIWVQTKKMLLRNDTTKDYGQKIKYCHVFFYLFFSKEDILIGYTFVTDTYKTM